MFSFLFPLTLVFQSVIAASKKEYISATQIDGSKELYEDEPADDFKLASDVGLPFKKRKPRLDNFKMGESYFTMSFNLYFFFYDIQFLFLVEHHTEDSQFSIKDNPSYSQLGDDHSCSRCHNLCDRDSISKFFLLVHSLCHYVTVYKFLR